MMFRVTSAAGAVHVGAGTLEHVLDQLEEEGSPRNEVQVLVSLAVDFMRTLTAEYGEEGQVPETTVLGSSTKDSRRYTGHPSPRKSATG
jgi:hypothetical protein